MRHFSLCTRRKTHHVERLPLSICLYLLWCAWESGVGISDLFSLPKSPPCMPRNVGGCWTSCPALHDLLGFFSFLESIY
ncbi:hypothetical protein BDZ94DRAFT_1262234 [Collybia nuda]|uniref:Uncharacterized protein n=1 Tax=Collybia nuda TaxID=64659 RepID=A0A9P5Y3J3_9AGAR|nr:hypothetical protein BDZ94DRAFT_1262234 [Collybia nuda]